MTNWKDGAPKGARGKKAAEKGEGKGKAGSDKRKSVSEHKVKTSSENKGKPVNETKVKSKKEWKKLTHVQRTVSDLQRRVQPVKDNDTEENKDTEIDKIPEETAEEGNEAGDDIEKVADENEAGNVDEHANKTEETETGKKTDAATTKKTDTKTKKEEPPVEDEDPQTVLRNNILQTIKNGFSIASTEEGEIQISVDNVYPLLKALGLNPQNESVMDMVRDACMESAGGIEPDKFDAVVLALVKEMDLELWGERLGEKARDALKESSEQAKKEAEKMKKIEAGEVVEEEEETAEEIERKAMEKAREKERERQEDELYDNLKMAFRFIDSDEDGVISVKDVYNLMMGLGQILDDDEMYGMVTMADLDCDGKLTFKDFKKFLMRDTAEGYKSDTEDDISALINPKKQAPTDEAEVNETTNDEAANKAAETEQNKTLVPQPPSTKLVATDAPPEEDSAKVKRRRSLLYGYTKKDSVKKMDEPEVKQQESEKEKTTEEQIETKSPQDNDELNYQSEETKEKAIEDSSKFLGAIREEDELSNSDADAKSPRAMISDQKPSITEGRRKMFSRQSSATSVKNKSNSIATNSESTIGDSGFETLDTHVTNSDQREVADVFEFSDDESELQKLTSSETKLGKQTESDIGDIDEDKIDDECVRESLSRVSDVSLTEQDAEEEGMMPSVHIHSGGRNGAFVDEYMYVGVDETDEEMASRMKTGVKLTRAQMLQEAILKRSMTEPALMHRYVPKPPTTPKTNINGIKCSHIDIDLRLDIPPKADIKSIKEFNSRVQSARTRPKSAYFDPSLLERKMSIVDMTQVVSEPAFNLDEDSANWPSRPMRPKSCRGQRLAPLNWETETSARKPKRSQSAAPLSSRRHHSPSPGPQDRHLVRPKTANLTYSVSRRTIADLDCTRLEKRGDFTVATTDPFVKSDKLYPRKTLLTSYHHGFKSIWPIGRNINVLQNKRPFSAFEMNSYSRAVERQEFPFQGETGIGNKENELKLTQRTTSTSTIKLELDPEGLVKPKIKKLSVLLPTSFTPRTVR